MKKNITIFSKLCLFISLITSLSLYGCNGLNSLFQDSEEEIILFQFPTDDIDSQYYDSENRPPALAPIGNKIVSDGELLQFAVSALDIDEDILTFSASNLPAGANFDPLLQIFSWTPDHSQCGNYRNVLFTVTDNGEPIQTDSEAIIITVGNNNRPPVLDEIGNKTTSIEEPLNFTIKATDPDGDDLIFSAGNLPAGAEFNPATGEFLWSNPATTGNYKNIIFIVTDNGAPSESDFEIINITVGDDVNRPPVLDPIGNRQVDEGESLEFRATASDTEKDKLTYSASNLPPGAYFNADTHIFNWSPGDTQTGNYKDVLFTVTDNGYPIQSDSESITISVGNVNRPPAFYPIGNRTIREDDHIQFIVYATDPEGDNLVYSASNLPTGASFDPATRVFSWTPDNKQSGVYPAIIFKVSDNGSPSESDFEIMTISVGENHPPVLDTIGNKTVQEGELIQFTITAADPDGDDLIFSASSLPAGAIFDKDTHVFSWTPAYTQSGSYKDILFTVTDSGNYAASDSEFITITVGDVNRPPTLNPIGNKTIGEGESLQFTITANDPDGDDLTFSASNMPAGAEFNVETQVFSWMPAYTQSGNYTNILFTVSDNGIPSESDSETITITVGNVNRPPALDPIGNKIIDEGGSLQFTITANDPDGDGLTFSASNMPAGAEFNVETQVFTWTPTHKQSGTYDILFTVTDSGSPTASDSEFITITVGDVNRPPTLNPIGNKTIGEGESLQFTITANDPDGDDLTFSASNMPSGAEFNVETQVFSWTPAYTQSGNYTNILFTVSDNGIPSESDSESITITVGNVNRPPALDPIGNKTIDEGESLQFTITANDPDGDDLTFSASNMPAGAKFDVKTQVFTWTPAYTQSGTYKDILFTATDNGSPTASDSEFITITVGEVNRPPVLDPIGNKTVDEGGYLQFTITANDPDGDDLTFSANNMPAGAEFDMESQVFSWTLAYTQSGNYTNILFTVSDNGIPSKSDSEAITITVGNVNRPPALDPIGNKTIEEEALLQFTLTATDPDGDNLIFSADNLPEGADLNESTGLFNWTPNYSQSGIYTDIIFTVTDDSAPFESDSETISITVINTDWWDTAWAYRKEITLTERALNGQLTEFQALIDINSDSLDFNHVASNMGDDIRFTYSSPIIHEETEIGYWIERWNSDIQEASLWVKAPEIPEGSASRLYMYYGNYNVNAASSLDNTFTKDYDTPGLVALWHMDEGSGSTITDSSGNNNTGICADSTYWTGSDGGFWGDSGVKFATGDSLNFDGASDYVQVADSSALDAGQITIELWFKANRLIRLLFADYIQGLLAKWNPDTNQRSYLIRLDGNDVRFYTSFDGSSYDYLEYGNVSTGTWYHIAATFNGSTKKIFLNGVERNSKSLSGVLHSGSSNLTIGIRSDLDNGRDFDGIIDEVAIYNRALSAGEIRAHYERRKYAYLEPTVTIGEEEN